MAEEQAQLAAMSAAFHELANGLNHCWCGLAKWHGQTNQICPSVPVGHPLAHWQATMLPSTLPFKCRAAKLSPMGLSAELQDKYDARQFRKHQLIRLICQQYPEEKREELFKKLDELPRAHFMRWIRQHDVDLGIDDLTTSRDRDHTADTLKDEFSWMSAMDGDQRHLRSMQQLLQLLQLSDTLPEAESVPEAMRRYRDCGVPSTFLARIFRFREEKAVLSHAANYVASICPKFKPEETGLPGALVYYIKFTTWTNKL